MRTDILAGDPKDVWFWCGELRGERAREKCTPFHYDDLKENDIRYATAMNRLRGLEECDSVRGTLVYWNDTTEPVTCFQNIKPATLWRFLNVVSIGYSLKPPQRGGFDFLTPNGY